MFTLYLGRCRTTELVTLGTTLRAFTCNLFHLHNISYRTCLVAILRLPLSPALCLAPVPALILILVLVLVQSRSFGRPFADIMSTPRILIYLLRRDLRLADNPVFHELSKSFLQSQNPYTHLLPLYIFPAQQLEVSGFLASNSECSPFPEARSTTGNFWRCGPHRAKFLAESVWDLKKSLENVGNGLEIRVGMVGQVVREVLEAYRNNSRQGEVVAVWMTEEAGVEEKREERDVRRAVEADGKNFKVWTDEKYYIDEYGVPLASFKRRLLTDEAEIYRLTKRAISRISSHPIGKWLSPLEEHLENPLPNPPNSFLYLPSFLPNQLHSVSHPNSLS